MKEELLKEGAERYRTPAYFFDLDEMKAKMQKFRGELTNKMGICFAMKANPFLTEQMAEQAERIEVCSMGEFAICRSLGIAREKLLISGVLKKEEELLEILEDCRGKSLYSIESLAQFNLLVRWSAENRERLHVLLRLSSGNQFGMDEDTLSNLICVRKMCPYLCIEGLHYFSGTQKKSAGLIEKELLYLDHLLCRLSVQYGYEAKELEYGPGLAVSYFKDEMLQQEEWKTILHQQRQMRWKGHITLEMGRALAAECGYYLTAVRDVKRNYETDYVIVDGGLHQMNYDGQIRGMYRPGMCVLSPKHTAEMKEYTVCGELCTANDILCRNVLLSRLNPGDVLVFKQTGAYSVTEGMALFLSHSFPKVVYYSQEKGWELARKEIPSWRWNMKKEETYGDTV